MVANFIPGIRAFYSYLFCLIAISFNLFAQGIKIEQPTVLFEDFIAYSNASQLETLNGIVLGNQSQFGAFSEIKLFYTYGSMEIGKSKNNGIGASLYSFQEGQLILENRLKGSYWKKIDLNDKIIIVAGGQVGLINTSIKATKSTAGSNDWTPNLDFGLTFKTKTSVVAVSINQLSNAEAKPLTQIIRFQKFYTLFLSQKIKCNKNIYCTILGNVVAVRGLEDIYNLKSDFDFGDHFSAGIGIGSNGLLTSIGLNSIDILGQKLSLKFGYQYSFFKSVSSALQPLHIHIKYQFSN